MGVFQKPVAMGPGAAIGEPMGGSAAAVKATAAAKAPAKAPATKKKAPKKKENWFSKGLKSVGKVTAGVAKTAIKVGTGIKV